MAETKKDATDTNKDASGHEPSTPASQGIETKPVVDLLTKILLEVKNEFESKTPKPLEGEALRAVDQFREIVAALALQPTPITIGLHADPKRDVPLEGDPAEAETTLTWDSTGAQTVKIEPGVGEVTPAAGGSIKVRFSQDTIFTATASGLCSSSTATETVTVDSD